MQELRANTAVDVLIGPFVEDGDGDSALTALTLDVELSKLGQALADSESAAPTHDSAGTVDGYYNCILGTTDTNTEGTLTLVVHHAEALPIRHDYMVMSQAAWDSKYAPKDDGFMDVNIKTVGRSDTQETEANNLESACSNYSVTRGLTGTAVPAAVADAGGGLPISDDGGLDMDSILEKMLAYFRLLMRSDAAVETDAGTELTAINADEGAGAGDYSSQTEANEAIKDHIGNGSNLTESGGTGDQLTAINLPNQTMDITGAITGNLIGDVTGNVDGTVAGVTPEAAGVAPTAAEVVNEWETQSQADPTGFHVNLLEVEGGDASDALEAAVDAAFENAIPDPATANSMNEYMTVVKRNTSNKMEITEANGNTKVYKDDDATQAWQVNAAFDSNAVTTTRLQLN